MHSWGALCKFPGSSPNTSLIRIILPVVFAGKTPEIFASMEVSTLVRESEIYVDPW